MTGWAVLNTVGFLGTWLGVALTFGQASQARSASESALGAANDAQSEIWSKQLLIQVGQLDRTYMWIELAVNEPNKVWVVRHMHSWQTRAAELVGLLQVAPKREDELITALNKANAMVGIALSSGSWSDDEGPEAALEAMREARLRVSTWISAMSMKIGIHEDE